MGLSRCSSQLLARTSCHQKRSDKKNAVQDFPDARVLCDNGLVLSSVYASLLLCLTTVSKFCSQALPGVFARKEFLAFGSLCGSSFFCNSARCSRSVVVPSICWCRGFLNAVRLCLWEAHCASFHSNLEQIECFRFEQSRCQNFLPPETL